MDNDKICVDDSEKIESFYSDLPTEILIQIFRNLDFYDLRYAGLSCRQWYAVTKLPEFDSQGIFKIKFCILDNDHPAAEVILDQKISKLYLNSVELDNAGSLLRHIGKSLRELTLKSIPIKTARQAFEYFPHLRHLKVCEIKRPDLIEDIEKLPLSNLIKLQELELTDNESSLNEYLLSCAVSAEALEKLTVEFGHNSNGHVFEVLKKHSNSLKRLDLHYYHSESLDIDEWIMLLSSLDLTELGLRGDFSPTILTGAIENKPSLRSLDVTGSIAVNDEFLTVVGEELLGLQRLILAMCGRITNQGLRQLAQLSQLKTLDISFCTQITSAGVRSITDKLPNYTFMELHLQYLALDEAVISFCAINFPNLRVFNLCGCVNTLTYKTFLEILHCQRELRELRVDCTERKSLLPRIPEKINLRHLLKLSIRGCHRLLTEILTCGITLPKLTLLDIADCGELTDYNLEQLFRNCPAIEEIYISSKDDRLIELIRLHLRRLRVLTVYPSYPDSITIVNNGTVHTVNGVRFIEYH